MSIQFPNVPIAPGVPAVARSILNAFDNTPQTPLTGSNAAINAAMAAQWGLYTQSGDLAAPVDNVIAVDTSLEAAISDYPVEGGSFGTYNKVLKPIDVHLVMSRGGSVEDRQDFLFAIQDAWRGTELFNVWTPEYVYLDQNVVGVRRMMQAERGGGLVVLEITLRQVRQTAKLAFTNTKDAASSGQVNDGSVQPQATTATAGAR